MLETVKENQEHYRKNQKELTVFVSVVNDLGKVFEEVALSADQLSYLANELTK